MGDSITEGTIVEWVVEPGTHVKEGDVLALIETDKVTVDIKADQEGVLIEQLGEVECNVEVGQGLYVLDTNVEGAVSATSEKKVSEMNAKIDVAMGGESSKVETEVVKKPTTRVPSIHFLGKDGWKARRLATDDSTTIAATPTSTTTFLKSDKPQSPSSVTQIPYSSMYGRPPITNDEMEALILGGAEQAPEVKSVVSEDGLSGVVFLGGKVVTAGPRGVWLAKEEF